MMKENSKNNKKLHSFRLALCLIFGLLASWSLSAQEKRGAILTTGESTIKYDLYFKYGLLYPKAGYADLSIREQKTAEGKSYKMDIISHSTGLIRKFFKLDDTLSCVMNEALLPIEYEKRAHEGKEDTYEQIRYKYTDKSGGVVATTKRIRNGELRYDTQLNFKETTYDMVSIVFYVRTLNLKAMQVGQVKQVSFISGDKLVKMNIRLKGIQNIEASDKQVYECYQLSLAILDPAFANPKEAMSVYLTTDGKALPIRMDTKLKIGSARAILNNLGSLKY